MIKKINFKNFFILLILFFSVFSSLNAENFNINFKPEKEKIFLGDRVGFSVKISSDKNIIDISDNISAQLKSFIVSDIRKNVGENNAEFDFYIQFFKTGNIVLPELDFILKTADGTYTIYTNKLKINVLSNLKDNETFKPVKHPIKVGFYLTTKEFIQLLLFLIVLFAVIYFFWKLKHKTSDRKNFPVLKSPVEEIKEFFESGNRLIKEGKIREFYFKLSESLRKYIDRKYHINTLESTIKEIEQIFFTNNSLDNNVKNILLLYFKKWEYYKFTDNFPLPESATKDLEEVKKIVEQIENREENV